MRLADSVPQPDPMLLRRRPGGYWDAHPGPEDAFLVAEVAETSAAYDRQVKLPLYAEAGAAEAWLVGLARRRVEVHRSPAQGRYREVTLAGRRDRSRRRRFPAP